MGFLRSLLAAAIAVVLAVTLLLFVPRDGDAWRAAIASPDVAVAVEGAGTGLSVVMRQAAGSGEDGGAGLADDAVPADGDDVPPEMRQQLADIARAYADNSRYPSYATPLSANDWAQLNPRAFVARSVALADMPGATAAIVLEKSIVDRNSDLPVRVVLTAAGGATGEPLARTVRVLLQLPGKGESSAPVMLAPDAAASYAGVLPASALRALPAGEIVVVAEITFAGGERATVTAMARSHDSVARLTGLGDPRIEGADLVIPARFEVAVAGFYRVRANLFTADGNTPVSHLNAEFALAAGPQRASLKVHAVTLRAAGAAGPYLLRDVDITRLPDQPGDATGYGSAAVTTFAVRGFPLDAYSNESWEDPEARQRLAFLKKLAGPQ